QRQVEAAERGARLAEPARLHDLEAVEADGEQGVEEAEQAAHDRHAGGDVGELPARGPAPAGGRRLDGWWLAGDPGDAHGVTMVPPAKARSRTRLSRCTASS